MGYRTMLDGVISEGYENHDEAAADAFRTKMDAMNRVLWGTVGAFLAFNGIFTITNLLPAAVCYCWAVLCSLAIFAGVTFPIAKYLQRLEDESVEHAVVEYEFESDSVTFAVGSQGTVVEYDGEDDDYGALIEFEGIGRKFVKQNDYISRLRIFSTQRQERSINFKPLMFIPAAVILGFSVQWLATTSVYFWSGMGYVQSAYMTTTERQLGIYLSCVASQVLARAPWLAEFVNEALP